MTTFLIGWVLLGICTVALDIYLCKRDKEPITVGGLITGTTIHLLISPYCACVMIYELLGKNNLRFFKRVKDLWNKEIL